MKNSHPCPLQKLDLQDVVLHLAKDKIGKEKEELWGHFLHLI